MSGSGCTVLGTMPLLPLLLNAVLGFKLCPSPCLCYESSDLVDCRSRGLTRVPSSISHGTWLLDLSGNKVTEVHTGSFVGLWSLKVLLLSNNSIHILHPQFRDTCDGWSLSQLSRDDRQGTPWRSQQSITGTQKTSQLYSHLWPEGGAGNLTYMFYGCVRKSEYLEISCTGRTCKQSLSSLQFLERLDLSFNRLRWLSRDFSQGLYSLQELRLSHNLLQHLDSTSLEDCDNLKKLDLSYNQIRRLDIRALNSLSRLSLLNLDGNRLNVLKDGQLNRQQALEVLLLNYNNISKIEAEALAPLRRLTLLGLKGNQLEHTRFKTFLKLQTTSTYLQMSLNPWFCDCELQRIFGKINHMRHLHVEDYKDIICHAPTQLAGSLLASMDSKLCIAETASVLVITITVMLAVIGALVKAERNQKNKQASNEAESQEQEK